MARTKQPVTLDEASRIMGLSKEALRKRIARKTIQATKDAAGRWRVVIPKGAKTNAPDAGQDGPADVPPSSGQVQSLQDEIKFLREELSRKDMLLMNMMQRLPALPPPQDRRGFLGLFRRRSQQAGG